MLCFVNRGIVLHCVRNMLKDNIVGSSSKTDRSIKLSF